MKMADYLDTTAVLENDPKLLMDAIDFLVAIRTHGELANLPIHDFDVGGKKPASKDVFAFPRHMTVELDALLTRISLARPSTMPNWRVVVDGKNAGNWAGHDASNAIANAAEFSGHHGKNWSAELIA
jgi:hypothetical protein